MSLLSGPRTATQKHKSIAQAERTQWIAVYLALATQANEVKFLHLKHFLYVEAFLVYFRNDVTTISPALKYNFEVLYLSIYFIHVMPLVLFFFLSIFCFTATCTVNHPSVSVLNLCIFTRYFVIWPSL